MEMNISELSVGATGDDFGGFEVIQRIGEFVILKTKWNAFMVLRNDGNWHGCNEPSIIRAYECLPASVRDAANTVDEETAVPLAPFSVWLDGPEIDTKRAGDIEIGLVFAVDAEQAQALMQFQYSALYPAGKLSVGRFC